MTLNGVVALCVCVFRAQNVTCSSVMRIEWREFNFALKMKQTISDMLIFWLIIIWWLCSIQRRWRRWFWWS